MIKLLILIIFLFISLLVISLCSMSAECDKRDREMYEKYLRDTRDI